MKCYGDFICRKCGTMTHETFDIESEEMVGGLSITCPECGEENVQLTVPSRMKEALEELIKKGYHVIDININTLAVVFKGHPLKDITTTPSEFILDTTEPDSDVLFNERMRVADYDGFDENVYKTVAARNLINWCKELPSIKE